MTRTQAPLRAAVVNDYEIVVHGVAQMLADHADRVVVVELDSRLTVAADVDVVLCDSFGFVEGEGVDLPDLVASTSGKVVFYSWSRDPAAVARALAQGAAGYISKSLTGLELVEALEAVHRGETVTSEPGEDRNPQGGSDHPGRAAGLTPREAEVLALIAKGLSNEEIADVAFLSINTIKTHIRHTYAKIGVTRRPQAVVWALQNGFVPVTHRESRG